MSASAVLLALFFGAAPAVPQPAPQMPAAPSACPSNCETRMRPDGPHCENCQVPDGAVIPKLVRECRVSLVLTSRGVVVLDGSTSTEHTWTMADAADGVRELIGRESLFDCGTSDFPIALFADTRAKARALKLRKAFEAKGLRVAAPNLGRQDEAPHAVFRSREELGDLAGKIPERFPFDRQMLVLGSVDLRARLSCPGNAPKDEVGPVQLTPSRPGGLPIVAGSTAWEPPRLRVWPVSSAPTCGERLSSLAALGFKTCSCDQDKAQALIAVPRTDLPVRFAPTPR